MNARSHKRFLALLAKGDVVSAIIAAPFGYTSRLTYAPDGYRFVIHDGPLAGVGEGSTLIDAVRAAVASAAVSLPGDEQP